VYTVPQVLAATLPIGALSNQVGIVVKLVRALMLGPVVLGQSLLARELRVGWRPYQQEQTQLATAPALVHHRLSSSLNRPIAWVDSTSCIAMDHPDCGSVDDNRHGRVGSRRRHVRGREKRFARDICGDGLVGCAWIN
jgi:hypothetical protein